MIFFAIIVSRFIHTHTSHIHIIPFHIKITDRVTYYTSSKKIKQKVTFLFSKEQFFWCFTYVIICHNVFSFQLTSWGIICIGDVWECMNKKFHLNKSYESNLFCRYTYLIVWIFVLIENHWRNYFVLSYFAFSYPLKYYWFATFVIFPQAKHVEAILDI